MELIYVVLAEIITFPLYAMLSKQRSYTSDEIYQLSKIAFF